nr:Chain K, Octapeptide [synthetic construct]5K58_L Chain L, Octapeptide [synthetic construct]5K58_M Chain M, Octapeptide [synthetic construct]5K58_N Chain N, Octapeptide [synthetic construct]
LDIPAFLR